MMYVASYSKTKKRSDLAVADACREAGLAFLEGVAYGWTKADLASWLTGPYSALVFERGDGETPPGLMGDVSTFTDRIQLVMRLVRISAFYSLQATADPSARAPFAVAAIQSMDIAPTEGGWVPIDRLRMTLRDRLLSLFAVDYLFRPTDYVESFFICPRCDKASFDVADKWRGECSRHGRLVSEVVPRDPHPDPLMVLGGLYHPTRRH